MIYILWLVMGVGMMVCTAAGYALGHTVGYSEAYWERTKQLDRLLGCATEEATDD